MSVWHVLGPFLSLWVAKFFIVEVGMAMEFIPIVWPFIPRTTLGLITATWFGESIQCGAPNFLFYVDLTRQRI